MKNAKLSISMQNAHSSGRHPGWAHKNQDLSRSSYPERWFREAIKNDAFLSQCKVKEQLSQWKYFLDFAFIEYMVALEIDGKQHLLPKQVEKDKIRDTYLVSIGWKVYRIEWRAMFEETKQKLEDFKLFLLSSEKVTHTYIKSCKERINHKPKKERLLESRQTADNRMKMLQEAKIDFSQKGWTKQAALILGFTPPAILKWMRKYFPEESKLYCPIKIRKEKSNKLALLKEKRKLLANKRMELITNANIDFNKFGWVQKVADLLNISPQGVNKWIKQYFPDVYKTAFRRNVRKIH